MIVYIICIGDMNMEVRSKEKMFIMRINESLHNELKKRSNKFNMNMTQYVVSIINEQILKENQYDKNE